MSSLPQMDLSPPRTYRDAHIELDFENRVARLDGRTLELTRKEYDLLALLVENAGEIVPRETLLMRVWGYTLQIRTRTLDVHIRRLRRKLDRYAELYIETIFGIGYRFQPYRVQKLTPVRTPVLAVSV